MNVIPYTHIVLSGGGIQGIAYIGIYRILKQYQLLEKAHHLIGCSIGAVFAYLYALNLEVEEMENLFDMVFKDPSYTEFDAEHIWSFIEKKGMYSTERFRRILILAYEIKYKEKISSITFQEFSKITGKNIYVTAVGATTMKTKIFSNIDTPTIDVFTAIQASMAIPGFFQPIVINEEFYMDGGVDSAIPLQCISYKTTDHILVIYLKYLIDKTFKDLQHSTTYIIHTIISIMFNNGSNAYLNIYKHYKNVDIIELDKNPLPFLPIEYLDTKINISITPELLEQGIFYGYNIAYQYLKETFIDSPSQTSSDSLPCD